MVEKIPEVNGFFFALVAKGYEDKYRIGWKIMVERCPYTKNSQGVDYIGDAFPELGKVFGEFVMPNTDGKKVSVKCTKIEPGWEAPKKEAPKKEVKDE